MILKGKKALVTGATGGLGRQICFSLAFAGCKVYATGTNAAKLDELRFLINSIHDACLGTYELDLTDEKSIKKTCSDLKVDILINCAGTFGSDEQDPSFAFTGTSNISKQGVPINIVYGETLIGSNTISANVDSAQVVNS